MIIFIFVRYHDGVLVVKGSSSVNDTFDDLSAERLMNPLAIDGHDVHVCSQHVGQCCIGLPAFDLIE